MRRGTPEPKAAALPGLPVTPQGQGRGYRAYPNLHRARWLFPAGRPDLRRSGIRGLFRPSSPKGHALRALILAGGLPGQGVSLRPDALEKLEDEISGALAEPEVGLAFYLGVPGAYRKVTVQVMAPGGRTLAFAKVSASPMTRELIERERRVLLKLSGSEGLRGKVPEVLHAFDWGDSRVLLITGGPDGPGPRRLTRAHLDLCGAVFSPFAHHGVFEESAMLSRMSRTLLRVRPHLPDLLSSTLHRALGRVREDLGPARLPLSLCHRDFAPWNTRTGARGLFVFDWDGAKEGTVPLYDLFHFQAIQAALFGRRVPLLDRALLRAALDDVWPEGREHLSSLYLAYLLDMALFYGEARVTAPEVGDDRVWDWFCAQIEAFLKDGPPL